jgi:hypothetical protein
MLRKDLKNEENVLTLFDPTKFVLFYGVFSLFFFLLFASLTFLSEGVIHNIFG